MGFIWWVILAAFWVIFLFMTMSIARSKGHSPLLWGLLAVFFPCRSRVWPRLRLTDERQ
jgi:hypothetical protein